MRRNGLDSTKHEDRRLISRNDIILIVLFLIIAVGVFLYFQMNQKKGASVDITIDGQEYGTYSLNEDQTISIKGEDFVSTLVIKDGEASMTEADCPDQICVKHRPISRGSETIVCLPHKVVCEVISSDEESTEGIDAIVK